MYLYVLILQFSFISSCVHFLQSKLMRISNNVFVFKGLPFVFVGFRFWENVHKNKYASAFIKKLMVFIFIISIFFHMPQFYWCGVRNFWIELISADKNGSLLMYVSVSVEGWRAHRFTLSRILPQAWPALGVTLPPRLKAILCHGMSLWHQPLAFRASSEKPFSHLLAFLLQANNLLRKSRHFIGQPVASCTNDQREN